jgi:DNA-binding transcriptional regulator YiaG
LISTNRWTIGLTIVSLCKVWNSRDIRRLRSKLGLNQSQFARLVGVDVRSVIRWESSKGPRPKGSAEAVMTGIREKLEADPSSAKKVIKLLTGAAAVGGLAYLLVKLLGSAADDDPEEA